MTRRQLFEHAKALRARHGVPVRYMAAATWYRRFMRGESAREIAEAYGRPRMLVEDVIRVELLRPRKGRAVRPPKRGHR